MISGAANSAAMDVDVEALAGGAVQVDTAKAPNAFGDTLTTLGGLAQCGIRNAHARRRLERANREPDGDRPGSCRGWRTATGPATHGRPSANNCHSGVAGRAGG